MNTKAGSPTVKALPHVCTAIVALAAASCSGAVMSALDRTGGDACSGPLDCQLNGVCNTTGQCECGAAWTGGNCSRLNLLPATKGAGFYTANSSWSSWGNMVSRDPQSGKYYMAADEMASHCGAMALLCACTLM